MLRSMTSGLRSMILKGVPGTAWLIGVYSIIIFTAATMGVGPVDLINAHFFTLPLVQSSVPMTVGDAFVILTLFSVALEALRAIRIHDRSGNDILSLFSFAGAGVLFLLFPWYSTGAFLYVVVAGAVDLLLDRLIGQAVARRDIGIGGGALYGSHIGE